MKQPARWRNGREFILELYRLADSCEYGNLKDEMIGNRLVVGIRDDFLCHCMLKWYGELYFYDVYSCVHVCYLS